MSRRVSSGTARDCLSSSVKLLSRNVVSCNQKRMVATTGRSLRGEGARTSRFHQPTSCYQHFSTSSRVNFAGTLRNMMKPFYLKCHPDVQASETAKEVNLAALKTINSLMDTMEATCNGKLVDWPITLDVEFLIPIHDPKVKKMELTSRRTVELLLPPKSLRDTIIRSMGEQKQQAMESLQRKIKFEFAKILKIAGLPAPDLIDYANDDGSAIDMNSWLHDEIGLNDYEDGNPLKPKRGMNHSFGGRQRFTTNQRPERPQTPWEQSRARFTSNIDQKKLNEMYQGALVEMQADIATYGYMKDARRRQDFISSILARVRLDKDATKIDTMEQLVAFRRFSLIFNDNFDDLKFEDMGKMWEELTIVLTDPRSYSTAGTSIRKRKTRFLDSGFRFTYSADNTVTVHIPIDFQDDELMVELKQNLSDFAELVGDSFDDIVKKCMKKSS